MGKNAPVTETELKGETMSYYHVEAKMGHVGKGRYFKGNLYIWAENGREAATKARNCPRVKHDRKDAIISVRAISEDEYMKGREENEKLGYFRCRSIQEQRECYDEIAHMIYTEEPKEERKPRKKHSMKPAEVDDIILDYDSELFMMRNVDLAQLAYIAA